MAGTKTSTTCSATPTCILCWAPGPFYTSPTAENSLSLSLDDLTVVILNDQTHHIDFYDRDVITGDDWLRGWSFTPCGQATWPIQGDNTGELQLSNMVVESGVRDGHRHGVGNARWLVWPRGGERLWHGPEPCSRQGSLQNRSERRSKAERRRRAGHVGRLRGFEICLLQIVQEFNKLRLKPRVMMKVFRFAALLGALFTVAHSHVALAQQCAIDFDWRRGDWNLSQSRSG